MKRNEMLLEIPHVGEVLLEPTRYSNGREGYMVVQEGRSYNLTLNMDWADNYVWDDEGIKEPIPILILKMFGEAEPVSRHLLNKTDMFKRIKTVAVGINYGQLVTLNPAYYEQEKVV